MTQQLQQEHASARLHGGASGLGEVRPAGPARSAETLRGFLKKVSDPCEAPPTRLPSGLAQLDEALGGGLAEGALCLVPGPAGGGKSTLAFTVAGAAIRSGASALYVCTERATREVQLEAQRVGAPGDLMVIGADHVQSILDIEMLAADQHPRLLVVDSLHSSAGYAVGGKSSTASQVEAAHRLAALAREHQCVVLTLGQVTKTGHFRGNSEIGHIVDVIVHLDWEEETGLRALTVGKNRFGPSGGQAFFELGDAGVIPLGRHLVEAPASAEILPFTGREGQWAFWAGDVDDVEDVS